MENQKHNVIKIKVEVDGKVKLLTIGEEETTDSVPYFYVDENGKTISQIRKDEDGNWLQIWGDLSDEALSQIGSEIDEEKQFNL